MKDNGTQIEYGDWKYCHETGELIFANIIILTFDKVSQRRLVKQLVENKGRVEKDSFVNGDKKERKIAQATLDSVASKFENSGLDRSFARGERYIALAKNQSEVDLLPSFVNAVKTRKPVQPSNPNKASRVNKNGAWGYDETKDNLYFWGNKIALEDADAQELLIEMVKAQKDEVSVKKAADLFDVSTEEIKQIFSTLLLLLEDYGEVSDEHGRVHEAAAYVAYDEKHQKFLVTNSTIVAKLRAGLSSGADDVGPSDGPA